MVEKKLKTDNASPVSNDSSTTEGEVQHKRKGRRQVKRVIAQAKKDIIQKRGKRKEAVARVTLKEGKGRIRINKKLLSAYDNEIFKKLIQEPLVLTDTLNKFDIDINVRSGGVIGQAQAIRTAITNAILEYYDSNENLRKQILDYDRSLLVEDYRRIEPKKYKGRKARARFQKSYR
ncbi:MAG: 30S ribosomal protein S9 [Candidatus Anstonellales archaeon]